MMMMMRLLEVEGQWQGGRGRRVVRWGLVGWVIEKFLCSNSLTFPLAFECRPRRLESRKTSLTSRFLFRSTLKFKTNKKLFSGPIPLAWSTQRAYHWGYVVTFAPARKPFLIGLTVHIQQRSFRPDFCNGAKLSRADLLSGESHRKGVGTLPDRLFTEARKPRKAIQWSVNRGTGIARKFPEVGTNQPYPISQIISVRVSN